MVTKSMFLRNTLAILLGLSAAFVVITLGITINKALFFPELKDFVENWKILYTNWEHVIKSAHYTFFMALLFSAGLGALIGGLITAVVVKQARVAYALSIGFLLAFFAWIDIFLIAHPFWYIVSLNFVLFFFSWLGGRIISLSFREG